MSTHPKGGRVCRNVQVGTMDATTKTFRGIKVGSSTLLVAQGQQNIILTKPDYKHHRVGTPRSSYKDPSRGGFVNPPRRLCLQQCMEPPRRVHGGAFQAPRILLDDTLRKVSRSLLEAFVKPSRRVADSLNNDTSPNSLMYQNIVTTFYPISPESTPLTP